MEKNFIDKICIGRNNCFDALRYFFAISLIIVHVTTLADKEQFWAITGSLRVKAFFVITGYLVTYSFIRRNELKSYIKKRAARILPAYLCCILFCLVLGLFLSSLSAGDFLSSKMTCKYVVANIFMLNWLEPCLPGVFTSNSFPQMNGSLWSMKFEVIFYAIVPFYVFVCRRLSRIMVTTLTAGMIFLAYPHLGYHAQVFCYFFSAILVLFNKETIDKYFPYVFLAACLNIIAVRFLSQPEWLIEYFLMPLEVFSFAIVLIGIAFHFKPLFFLARYDNISYGLYLYHFPIAQAIISLNIGKESLSMLIVLTFIVTWILATVSWYCIEKPILKALE